MLLLRVTALFIGVHAYVFLSGLVYHFLESPTKTETVTKHLEQVVDKFLVSSPSNGPKKSKQELIVEIQSAVEKDKNYSMRKSFTSLWKSYMFALTTVTTVGNSGLYLQTWKSRLFFVFTAVTGMVLYVCLIHYIGIMLLTLLKRSVDFGLMKRLDKRDISSHQFAAKLLVLVLSYLITFSSVVIMGLGALVSGHGYTFGLYVISDAMLTVGNFTVLAYVYPWNEAGFVICLNMILLMGLSFLYTSVYLTFQFATGSDFNELIKYWWDEKQGSGYELVGQEEERPFEQFLSQAKSKRKGKKRSDESPLVLTKSEKNPFLQEEEESGFEKIPKDPLSPPFYLTPDKGAMPYESDQEHNPFLGNEDNPEDDPTSAYMQDADRMVSKQADVESVDLFDTDGEEMADDRSEPGLDNYIDEGGQARIPQGDTKMYGTNGKDDETY
eukprot:Seg3000.2 transcript_id=Seg3000.2/GoldUCD/mRNA.D3Y31 product="Potassium channel subfamily K member 4" protein_id=Seg3000.2/GoldUCD/D3Y31